MKAMVSDKEYDIPEGIDQITEDGLFMVDFSLIEIAEDLDKEFFNPRHLGSYTYQDNGAEKVFRGQGFDGDSMKELLGDITKKGLDYPLLTRWIVDADGHVKVQVYDGERRWRCMDKLMRGKESVWSQALGKFAPANEVYAKVPCRVKVMSDEEAMAYACAVSETAVKWGDAALARLVKKEYERGKDDAAIAKMLNKGDQWVAETYALNKLDEFCFNYLLQGKINRTIAKKLLKITDEKERQDTCRSIYEDAVRNHAAAVQEAEKKFDKAADKEDLAKAQLEEAQRKGASETEIEELQEEVEAAHEKATKRKAARAASAKPMGKSKNLRNVAGGPRPVTSSRVNKQLKTIKELIDKNDETYGPVSILKMIAASLEALINGEDITEALKKAS